MQILKFNSQELTEKSYVLVFGLGLIGSATSRALQYFGYGMQRTISINWHDREALKSIFEQIKTECFGNSLSLDKLAVVWAAGDSAFHSSVEETNRELEIYLYAVTMLKRLVDEIKPNEFEFHLLSSAGGLFEGQQVVNMDSVPTPVRPYGELKAAQELALMKSFGSEDLFFHRPSSVYGPMATQSRKGLINNLIRNGQANRTTVLDAQVMALRDYVFSQDVGNYIARLIRGRSKIEAKRREYFLVSARSSSIFEVVRKVEFNFKIKLRIRFDPNFGNNSKITFSDKVLPPMWNPVPLDVGLRQFLLSEIAPQQVRAISC